MLFTVGEALQLKELRPVRVLAGSGGLGRELGFVTVMDAPDLGNWLRGKELVITTAFSIKDDPLALSRIIKELAEHGSAGIGIKLRRYIDRVSPDALDLADRLDVPVIEIPTELAWIDIITPVMSALLHRQARLLELSERTHKEFIRNVLEGGGLDAVARTLASVTGRPAIIVAAANNSLGVACPTPELAEAWGQLGQRLLENQAVLASVGPASQSATADEVRPEEITVLLGDDEQRILVLPARVHHETLGYVAVLADGVHAQGEDVVMALEHAATVTSLELLKLRATKEVERRFRSQFIFDLVGGNFGDERVLLDRAKALGWVMDSSFGVAVIDIDRFERFVAGKREHEIQAVKEAILREVTSATVNRFPGAICADRSDSVIVLIPLDPDHSAERNRETLNDHAGLLQRTLHGKFKSLTVSIGIGRSRLRPTDIPRSYDEARQALTMGRELYGSGVVVHFDDLGLYRFLTRGADRAEIVDFVEEHLGALLRHDQKHGSHLVDTLQAFLGANRNIRQAAQALFVHENTLKYRLQRIRQLGGFDLEDAEACFNLQVALRMHQLTSR